MPPKAGKCAGPDVAEEMTLVISSIKYVLFNLSSSLLILLQVLHLKWCLLCHYLCPLG